MDIIKENRIGRFTISRTVLDSNLDDVMRQLFSQLFIVRAEMIYWNDVSIEYIAFSELFLPVTEGCIPNTYHPMLHKEEDGTITFVGMEKVDE